MTPADDSIKNSVKQLKEKFKQNIDIQFIPQIMGTIISLLVIDKKYYLSVEVKVTPRCWTKSGILDWEHAPIARPRCYHVASIFESL